ncbi:unnamed protein product [Arabidopsis halleri]
MFNRDYTESDLAVLLATLLENFVSMVDKLMENAKNEVIVADNYFIGSKENLKNACIGRMT